MSRDPSNSQPPNGLIVGCYSLDLYCARETAAHDFGEFPHQFNEPERVLAFRAARATGWLIPRRFDRPALCPKCNPRSASYQGGEP